MINKLKIDQGFNDIMTAVLHLVSVNSLCKLRMVSGTSCHHYLACHYRSHETQTSANRWRLPLTTPTCSSGFVVGGTGAGHDIIINKIQADPLVGGRTNNCSRWRHWFRILISCVTFALENGEQRSMFILLVCFLVLCSPLWWMDFYILPTSFKKLSAVRCRHAVYFLVGMLCFSLWCGTTRVS